MGINEWLSELEVRLQTGERPESVPGPQGVHQVIYDVDDDDLAYARVEYALSVGFYAEIDDRTYGRLFGFRIYLEN